MDNPSELKVVDVFDVAAYELEDTAVLIVQNAQRTADLLYNKEPVKITVYSPGSKQGVRATHRATQAATLRAQGMMRGKLDKNSASQAAEERVAKLVAITANIENFPISGGAEGLYSNTRLIDIADQVEEFFDTKANFSKATTKA